MRVQNAGNMIAGAIGLGVGAYGISKASSVDGTAPGGRANQFAWGSTAAVGVTVAASSLLAIKNPGVGMSQARLAAKNLAPASHAAESANRALNQVAGGTVIAALSASTIAGMEERDAAGNAPRRVSGPLLHPPLSVAE